MSGKDKKKLVIVSSSGGHLFKTYRLKSWWSRFVRCWVVRDDPVVRGLLSGERMVWGYFPENRNIYNFFRNFVLAVKLLREERPDYIFSMGAGVALPFFLVAKVMGIKSIFMETFILIDRQTLTGRILYLVADHFIVQNEKLKVKYPKANYWGSVL